MKAAVFIDVGYLRVLVRQASFRYDPDYIEAVAHTCVAGHEPLRILYYNCAPYPHADWWTASPLYYSTSGSKRRQ